MFKYLYINIADNKQKNFVSCGEYKIKVKTKMRNLFLIIQDQVNKKCEQESINLKTLLKNYLNF